jgi:hypothetical protein
MLAVQSVSAVSTNTAPSKRSRYVVRSIVGFHHFVNSCTLFADEILCFQQFVNSFAKDTGGGWAHRGYELGLPNIGKSVWRRTMEATWSPSAHWRTMRSQRSRTHTESRRQGWWNIAQRISAARAASFVRSSRRGIRAQPMTARFAQLVDALHCESRQILHRFLRNCVALEPLHRVSITNSCLTELSYKIF